MYIEASSPRTRGDKAWLTSEEFFRTSSSGRCIKFWYNMYGNSIGSLKIYYKTNTTKTVIWGLSGAQSRNGSDWKFGQAPIRSRVVYQVCSKLLSFSQVSMGEVIGSLRSTARQVRRRGVNI